MTLENLINLAVDEDEISKDALKQVI